MSEQKHCWRNSEGKLNEWIYCGFYKNKKSLMIRSHYTWFFSKPHTIATCEGRTFPARYLRTPLELGRLDSSKWSDISKNNRHPISRVTSISRSNAELVTDSNWAIPVTTTSGFNFLISSTIESDCRGASMTATPPSVYFPLPVSCEGDPSCQHNYVHNSTTFHYSFSWKQQNKCTLKITHQIEHQKMGTTIIYTR